VQPAASERFTDWPILPSRGGVVGAVAAIASTLLGVALLGVGAAQRPGLLMGIAVALGAAAVAFGAVAAVLTAGFFTLRYRLLPIGLGIRWFGHTEIVAYSTIDGVFAGHRLGAIRHVRGLSWPGMDVGILRTRSLGAVRLFTRTREPDAISVIVAGSHAFALSPRNPQDFRLELIRRLEADTGDSVASPRLRRPSRLRLLMDPGLAGLTAASVALLAVTCALLLLHFNELSSVLAISFDGNPNGPLLPREEAFRLPLLGAAILAIDVILAAIFHSAERAAAYVVVGASAVVQSALFVALARVLG
jgi:hypothetical protein